MKDYQQITVSKDLDGGHESDHFQTPSYALPMLYPYLKKEWKIWEFMSGKGSIVDKLRTDEYVCYESDILVGINFFDPLITKEYCDNSDCLITNPAWSIKTEVLERCLEINKPFALLIPLSSLEQKVCRLVDKNGLEIIKPYQRIIYDTPNGLVQYEYRSQCWNSKEKTGCKKVWDLSIKICPECYGLCFPAKSSPTKTSMWLTYKLNIGKSIIYYDMANDIKDYYSTIDKLSKIV